MINKTAVGNQLSAISNQQSAFGSQQSAGTSRPQLQHRNIENLKGRKDPEALQEVAKELEALFAYEMIKAMRETSDISKEGLGKDTYMSMFDMELSRIFADRGLGLKEVLFKGLNRQKGSHQPSAGSNQVSAISNQRSAISNQPSAVSSQLPLTQPPSFEPSMPVDGSVSSKFGMRRHPIHGNRSFHHGMDIAAPEGTEIYPYRSGRVVFSGEQAGYGNMVIIDHGDGHISRYAHNRVNLVRAGEQVDDNTVIAQVGSTGISTGPHLHFEIRQDGRPLDPAKVLAMK